MTNEHNSQNTQDNTTEDSKHELTIHEKRIRRLKKLKEEDAQRQEKIKDLENSIKATNKRTINARKYAAGEWMIKQLEKGDKNVILALHHYIDDSRKYFFPEVFTENEIKEANARVKKRREENKAKRVKLI